MAQIFAPMVALPATNWPTVYHRLLKWTPCTTFGVGSAFLAASEQPEALQQRLSSVGNVVIALVKDAANYNQCMVRSQQDELLAKRSRGEAVREQLWDIDCQQHQCCLCTRPVVESVPGLATNLVRFAHLAQGSKIHADLEKTRGKILKNVPLQTCCGTSPRVCSVASEGRALPTQLSCSRGPKRATGAESPGT